MLAGVVWLLLVDAKLSRHQLWSEMMIRSEPNQFQLQKIVCFQLWRRSRAIYRHYLNEICAAGTILLECSVQRSVSVTIKILNDVAPESAHCCSLSAGCQSGAGAALIAAEMLYYYQLCTMRLIVWSGGDNLESVSTNAISIIPVSMTLQRAATMQDWTRGLAPEERQSTVLSTRQIIRICTSTSTSTFMF